ncbi:MAG TPA: Holliday junction branch migration protein RuvA [Terriglobales bacterium]|nr:Holliday junction branch migration protein RuvA [Terriglobales bacterium]
MIAHLEGTLLERHPARIILDVHGVGYELQVSVGTFTALPPAGGRTALHVYTQVRDDAILLFGFATAAEKQLFEKLISVNGVGPKMALAILSGLPLEALATAIRQADHARLTAIPGVGKKTAERLVVELRDKIPTGLAGDAAAAMPLAGPAEEVLSALVNLGYAPPAAEKAVQRALQQSPAASFDDLFMLCMKSL